VRTGEDHQAAKVDALGDILIYMLDYCNKCNIDLEDALNKTWEEVRKRDWIANPVTGKV
jgi:NTP pyrophosphatase (non-canonical NTP hydrolase)